MKKEALVSTFKNAKITKKQLIKIYGGSIGGDGALGGAEKPLTNPRRPKQD